MDISFYFNFTLVCLGLSASIYLLSATFFNYQLYKMKKGIVAEQAETLERMLHRMSKETND
jgi:hypothetical protein